jgi:hypothetical protein
MQQTFPALHPRHGGQRHITGFLRVALAASVTLAGTACKGPGGNAPRCERVEILLPQAAGGALRANPEMQPEVPLRIELRTEGRDCPTAVSVRLDGEAVNSTAEAEVGRFTARLPIASLAAGAHPLQVSTKGPQEVLETELHIGSEGLRFGDWEETRSPGTPRLHRRGGELWLTWVDRFGGHRRPWMQRIDGAGRPLTDRILLVDSEEPIYAARVAFGPEGAAVLFHANNPRNTRLAVVDDEGTQLMAPLDLDPPDRWGTVGADIAYADGAFHLAWRVWNQGSAGEVYWARLDASTLSLTGPTQVAASGNDDPDGLFPSNSFVKIEPGQGWSAVSFVRRRQVVAFGGTMQKAQLAMVGDDGELRETRFLTSDSDLLWQKESHVHRIGEAVVPVWTSDDFNEADPIQTQLQAVALDSSGAVVGDPLTLVQDANKRGEPLLVAHPSLHALMAWSDQRNKAAPGGDHSDLYVAPLNAQLALGPELRVPHAVLFSDLAQLDGAEVGGNLVLSWRDDRNGVLELFLESLWF